MNGGTDVRRCLKACNKMKTDQDICRKMCFRQYWQSALDDINDAAAENDIPQTVWVQALTTELEVRFGLIVAIQENLPAAIANGA